MFENVKIKGVHASRYIMSWVRKGGRLGCEDGRRGEFSDWLNSLGLSEEECDCILEIARSGRMELEASARAFIKNSKDKK